MPLYYFNVYNDEVTQDEEGAELVGDEAARAHAVAAARSLAAHSVTQGHLVGSHRVDILDTNRNLVGAVRFDEAVKITT